MRPTRAALVIAATALTPALLLATPAVAAGAPTAATVATAPTAASGTPVDEMSDDDVKVAIFRILDGAQKNNDRRVIQEATAALNDGSPEVLRAFLETGYRLAQAEDDSVAIFRILGTAQKNNDRRVIQEATAALDDGSPEVLRAFRETGYRLAQAEDDSVAIFRILGTALKNNDKRVIREANAALDDGSPEALHAFRETGYRLAQAEDDSVAIARILADPTISDALRAAAGKALDDGSPEALRYFLEHGRYEVDA